MKKRLGLMAIISILVMSLLAGCGKKETAKETEDNKLVVGLECGYAPYNWTQMDDSKGGVKIDGASEYAGGYDIEMAKKIADGLGKELVVSKIGWDGLVPALQSGKIDVIMAGMSPTEKRKESIDFSDNYYKSDLVMVVKKGSKFESAKKLADFKGAKITGQLNTFHYTVIDQIDGVEKGTAMEDFPTMRVALESGMIDGYVSERPEGVSASSANDNFVMVELEDGFEASDDDSAIAVGIAKDSKLTEDINKILKTISEEERTKIMDEAIVDQPAAN